MNFYLCSDRPKIFVLAQNDLFAPRTKQVLGYIILFISNHITQHLSEQGAHSLELIDRIISKSQLNVLQNKLITKIKAIEETKQLISIKITNFCQKIMKQGMSSIRELDLQAQWYLNLSSLSSFSVTLIEEVDCITGTELNIELFKKELSSKIPEFNYQETDFSKVSEVRSSNRIFEVCMGCSVYENVFQVPCKHLLCAICIKSPCKMCEFINAGEEKSKSSVLPLNLTSPPNHLKNRESFDPYINIYIDPHSKFPMKIPSRNYDKECKKVDFGVIKPQIKKNNICKICRTNYEGDSCKNCYRKKLENFCKICRTNYEGDSCKKNCFKRKI